LKHLQLMAQGKYLEVKHDSRPRQVDGTELQRNTHTIALRPARRFEEFFWLEDKVLLEPDF